MKDRGLAYIFALRCSVATAVLGVVGVPVSAQAVAATVPLKLPAQSLEQSLKDVARRTGVNILFAPHIVTGLRAPALNERMSAEGAVSRLISGKNLIVRGDGRGGLVLRARETAPVVPVGTSYKLPRTQLAARDATPQATSSASMDEPVGDSAPTEEPEIVVSGRFFDEGSKSAMKMDVSVLDTPFSVSSYSNAFVKSLETTSVADLYNYMNGVKKAGNTGYDLTMRGFRASIEDRNSIMVDGLPGLTGRFGSPPTIGIERIELVKGPMSVLYGQIQPGGFVNMITKKPLTRAAYSGEIRLNSFASSLVPAFNRNAIIGAIDATGPITADGALLYRFVAETGDRDGFRDFTTTSSTFIAPSLTWQLAPSTSITVQGQYQRTRDQFDTGLAVPISTVNGISFYDIARLAKYTTLYQQPGDFRVETGKSASVFASHDFGNNIKLTAGYRHVEYSSSQKEFSNTAVITVLGQPRVQRRARQLETERQYDYGDLNFQVKADTFGVKHQFLAGLGIGRDQVYEIRVKLFNSSNRNAAGVCPTGGTCLDVDLYNPDYSTAPSFDSLPAVNPQLTGQGSLLRNQYRTATSEAVYMSDLMTFTDWLKISLGARAFREKQVIEDVGVNTPPLTKVTSNKFLPSAGIMVQPNSRVTIYGSYAESFVPVPASAIDGNGVNSFGPISGKQVEFGVKGDRLLDGRLTATASLYQIEQEGLLTSFSCAFGTCSDQIGTARSRGFELEGNFTPVDRWQIIFGYSYIDAKVIKNNRDPSQAGLRLPNVAEHSANIWTRYDLENGLGFGIGVVHTGQREGILSTTRMNLPAYTIADRGLYFTKAHYSFNLKVGNIFDTQYIESAGSTPQIMIAPGLPRYITLTGRVKF